MSANNLKGGGTPSSSLASSTATKPANVTKPFVKSNSLLNINFEENTASSSSSFFSHKKQNTARNITFNNNNINDLKLSHAFQEPTTPIDKLNTPRTVTVPTAFFPPSPNNENDSCSGTCFKMITSFKSKPLDKALFKIKIIISNKRVAAEA